MTVFEIATGLYLVTVAGLGGSVVLYLMRTPRELGPLRPGPAAYASALLVCLLWPLLAGWLAVQRWRAARRRHEKLVALNNVLGRRLTPAELRRIKRRHSL